MTDFMPTINVRTVLREFQQFYFDASARPKHAGEWRHIGDWDEEGKLVLHPVGSALTDRVREALPEFSQQDDYLLAHGASLMSEDSHEIIHVDTVRRIVAAALAATPSRASAAVSEPVREALQMAIRQNSHDMLMTGEEIRQCEAALSAQPAVAPSEEQIRAIKPVAYVNAPKLERNAYNTGFRDALEASIRLIKTALAPSDLKTGERCAPILAQHNGVKTHDRGTEERSCGTGEEGSSGREATRGDAACTSGVKCGPSSWSAEAQREGVTGQASQTVAPSDSEPRLPHDVKVGHTTFRKGVPLSTFVGAAQRWHRAAYPDGYTLTDEQKAENLCKLQACVDAPSDSAKPAGELPPLPEPEATIADFGDIYQASHMRDYASAAIAAAHAPVGAMPDGSMFCPPTPDVAPEAGKPVAQFRRTGCSDWYDGHPDHEDGRGPYETRTLYAAPSAADGAREKTGAQVTPLLQHALNTLRETGKYSDNELAAIRTIIAAQPPVDGAQERDAAELINRLRGGIDDPMWPDHFEINKRTARRIIEALSKCNRIGG